MKLLKFAALSERNTSAAIPSSTKKPTNISVPFLFMILLSAGLFSVLPQRVENISAVSKKSIANTLSDETTTVRVVARATPSGVALAS